jgi:hypothetical protein
MTEHRWEHDPKGGAHGEYAMKCAACGMGDADKDADKECPGDSISPDLAIAIGEHAFAAGFDAGRAWHSSVTYGGDPGTAAEGLHKAWSAYTPPEKLCGGGSS